MHRWLNFLIVLFSLAPGSLLGQLLDINLQPYNRLTAFSYQAMGDEVAVMSNDSFPDVLLRLNTLERIEMENEGNGVRLKQDGKSLGVFPEVILWCNDPAPRFKISPTKAKGLPREYPGHLIVRPGGRGLVLVNRVFLEDYIRCVIHAEAGHHKTLDFFKVQALSARTYALRNMGRHGKVGYDLCDNTHCQAYKGLYASSPLLDKAVDETVGEVIVHDSTTLIEAVFSANCGGFTANSEDVWIAKVDYLRAAPDYEFCEGFSNHAWHVTIPKLDFLARLGQYFKVEATQFDIVPDVSGRVRHVYINGDRSKVISGEELRGLFRLKSSKFHVYDAQTLLFVEGSGFGHGVGMCQDGAYYLSKMGMDYEHILKHYYQGISIVNLSLLPTIW